MDGPIIYDFLNGMPFREFIVLFVWALVGALLSFSWSVIKAVRTDPNTAYTFQWKYFWTGALRTVVTIFGMASLIIFWSDLSPILFASESAIQLKASSAFTLIGIGSDKLTEVLYSLGKDGPKALKGSAIPASLFLLVILSNSGCVTQKRCFDKFPQDTIRTVERIPGETVYRDTSMNRTIEGDSAYTESPWLWNDDSIFFQDGKTPTLFNIPPIYASTRIAHGKASVENGVLKLGVVQDEQVLTFLLDSATRENTDTMKIYETRVIEKVVKPKNYGFLKAWGWTATIVAFILGLLLILFFKLK